MRPQTPIPLTLEEHNELGSELRDTCRRMHELCDLVVGVYGPQNSAAFAFQKAVDALDRLCGDLQAQASQDLPGYKLEGMYL